MKKIKFFYKETNTPHLEQEAFAVDCDGDVFEVWMGDYVYHREDLDWRVVES